LSDENLPSRMLFESVEPSDDTAAVPEVPGFRLVRIVGAGSSATVWLAEQTRPFTRRVALKVFCSSTGSQSILARFRTERDTLARLPREGFCMIHDAGLCVDGRPYLSMEFVDGEDLLAAARALSDVEHLARLFVEIAETVGKAHALGHLHLDLKPSNILIERGQDGTSRVRVIDFGLAGEVGAPSAGRGSRGFASPEVQEGGLALEASDVYSIAAMLRHALSVRREWMATGLGRRLDGVARRNLSPEPERRAQDARALAIELMDAIKGSQRRRLLAYGAAGGAAVVAAAGVAWMPGRLRAAASGRSAGSSPVERHVPKEYPTIQAAVEAARPGDIIRIAPGVHRGAVRIEGKSVSLQGMPGMAATTILDAEGYGAEALGLYAVQPLLSTIRDITITHSGVAGPSACGIACQQGSRDAVRFERCIIRDNIAYHDGIPGGANLLSNAVFESCAFIGNRAGYRGAAFAAYDGCHVEAIGCSFRDHPVGAGLIATRVDATVLMDGCVIVGSNRLCTSRDRSRIVFRNCTGSGIRVVGGTGFVDGGANRWECCVDADGSGTPDLEDAILGCEPPTRTALSALSDRT
jgi:hypothetical protein